jgi:hypothetical protein
MENVNDLLKNEEQFTILDIQRLVFSIQKLKEKDQVSSSSAHR